MARKNRNRPATASDRFKPAPLFIPPPPPIRRAPDAVATPHPPTAAPLPSGLDDRVFLAEALNSYGFVTCRPARGRHGAEMRVRLLGLTAHDAERVAVIADGKARPVWNVPEVWRVYVERRKAVAAVTAVVDLLNEERRAEVAQVVDLLSR
jgi:hypothetical protein